MGVVLSDTDSRVPATTTEGGSVSTEVAVPDEVLNPITGEMIPATDLDKCAEAIDMIRDWKQRIATASAALTEVFIEASRVQGTRTLTAAGMKVEVSSDNEIEWDFEELGKLRDIGLPEQRFDELIRPTITYKVDGRVAAQLAGSNPEYKRIIENAKNRIPKRQYVSVKPL